jgi:hypothetical protein
MSQRPIDPYDPYSTEPHDPALDRRWTSAPVLPSAPPPYPPMSLSPTPLGVPTGNPYDRDHRAGAGLWVVAIVVVLVLCGALGVGGYLLLREAPGDASSPTAGASLPAPSVSRDTRSVTLRVPSKLTGYSKINTAEARAMSAKVAKALAAGQGGLFQQAIAGSYGNVSKHQLRIFAAMKLDVGDPGVFMNGVVEDMEKDGDMRLSNVATVPAGPLGGVAKCGEALEAAVVISICAWVDEGSVAFVFFFGQKLSSTVKTAFLQARAEIETRK